MKYEILDVTRLAEVYATHGWVVVCDGAQIALTLQVLRSWEMSNKNEVFEYLIGQLRQQVNGNQCEDLAHEVLSLKNQLRDASALVAELQKELDIANSTVVRLRKEIAKSTGDIGEYIDATEQSGCRKEDTQYNAWRPHYGARQPVPDGTMVFIRYRNGEEPKHSVAAEKRSWIWDGTYADIVEYKIDTQECEHDYRLVLWCSDLQQCSKCGAIK